MNEVSTICEQCGGQKTVYIKIEPVYANGYTPAVHAVTGSSMRICMCPLPREKHDGYLNKNRRVKVYWREEFNDVMIDRPIQTVYLEPSEALSLLTWLKQEQDTLEQLAQEQAT